MNNTPDTSAPGYRCNLVVAGFPKCGTSSLHAYMDLHDQVCMSSIKEPHFFGRPVREAQGAQAHNALFEGKPGARWFGESSTGYCINPAALGQIRRNLADPRIILVLRDPVARLLSHYKWLCAQGDESRPLMEAVQTDGFGFDPEKPRRSGKNFAAYLQFGNYSKYVPMWESEFGRDKVLLLSTEGLARDPDGSLAKVWEFLGVPRRPVQEVIETNTTRDISGRMVPRWLKVAARSVPTPLKKVAVAAGLKKVVERDVAVEPRYTEADVAELRRMVEADAAFCESRVGSSA